jgi:putative tricarboxylic transport membrane protein
MKERLRLALPHTVLLLIAGLLYYAASLIDKSGAGGTRIGPDFWPKVIIGAMAALCIYEIGKRLISGNARDVTGLTAGLDSAPLEIEGVPVTAPPVTKDAPPDHGRLAAGVALIAAFVFSVAYVGFFVGTALFLALFTWIGGYRRALPVVLVSVIGAFVLLVIFMRVAYISLPLGVGPFQHLSVLLLRLTGV